MSTKNHPADIAVALIAVVLSLATATESQSATTVPVQWGGNGHWYQVITMSSPLCWTQCRDSAVALGGYLACINSAQEDSFIVDSLNPPPIAALVGGYEPQNNGVWVWVCGDTFYVNGDCSGYCNWNVGEPNNSGGVENYLTIFAHGAASFPGTWNDVADCVGPNEASFIVEYPCNCIHQGDLAQNRGDGVIDVFDVIAEIAIAFSGEPDLYDPFCPTTRGDVNNDTVTDVFDVIYLIDHAFSGGPTPADPCNP